MYPWRTPRFVAALLAAILLLHAPTAVAGVLLVDIGRTGQRTEAGWQPFTGNTASTVTHSYDASFGTGGTGGNQVAVGITAPYYRSEASHDDYKQVTGVPGFNDVLSGAALMNDTGQTITLNLGNLADGEYLITTYHHSSYQRPGTDGSARVDIRLTDSASTNELVHGTVPVSWGSASPSFTTRQTAFTVQGGAPTTLTFPSQSGTDGENHATLNAFALGTAPAPLPWDPSQSAPVTWQVHDIDGAAGLGDALVESRGRLVEAANFGNTEAVDVTVNGVPFQAVNFGQGDSASELIGFGYDTGGTGVGTSFGGDVDVLTDTYAFRSGFGEETAWVTGLEPGKAYSVQYFMSQTTHLSPPRTLDIASGGETATLSGVGQVATGQFIAVSETQFFTFDASTGSQFLNGFQVREALPTLNINIDTTNNPLDNQSNFALPLGYQNYKSSDGQANTIDFAAPFGIDGTVGVTVDSPFFRNARQDGYASVTALDTSGDVRKGLNAVMSSHALVNMAASDDGLQITLDDLIPGNYQIKFWLHSIWGGSDGQDLSWNIRGAAEALDVPVSTTADLGGLDDISSIVLPFTVTGGATTAEFLFEANQLVSGAQLAVNGFELTYIPEPGAWLLLVSALVCGLPLRRRR